MGCLSRGIGLLSIVLASCLLVGGICASAGANSSAVMIPDPGGLYSGRAELKKLQKVYREFLVLQKKETTDAEWKTFQKHVHKEIDPVVARLKKTASSMYPHLQHLLWAGRDYLPWMLRKARTGKNEDQIKFERHLKAAEKLILKPKPAD